MGAQCHLVFEVQRTRNVHFKTFTSFERTKAIIWSTTGLLDDMHRSLGLPLTVRAV